MSFLKIHWGHLGTSNRLLKSVLEDASCDLYLSGCKALGLIDKHITGPLWRILESNIHILDLTQYYKTLLCNGFITGETVPFPNQIIRKDSVWVALVAQSQEHDQIISASNS